VTGATDFSLRSARFRLCLQCLNFTDLDLKDETFGQEEENVSKDRIPETKTGLRGKA